MMNQSATGGVAAAAVLSAIATLSIAGTVALNLPGASGTVSPDTTSTAAQVDDEPEEEEDCPPNGCGGNHSEHAARDGGWSSPARRSVAVFAAAAALATCLSVGPAHTNTDDVVGRARMMDEKPEEPEDEEPCPPNGCGGNHSESGVRDEW
ncbi:hypothetical protein OG474_00720 [Kribbella sp. NBC_01505]|uniref:hypothetical protein n=1 Tax=Kribbella sp. NBC_01505 TaxID=2903580 RepID=UPI003867CA34